MAKKDQDDCLEKLKCIGCYLKRDSRETCRLERLHTAPAWSEHKCVALIKERTGTRLPAGKPGRQLIADNKSDCPQCQIIEDGKPLVFRKDYAKEKSLRTEGRAKEKSKTKGVEKPKTEDGVLVEVISIEEAKTILVAYELEKKLAQCKDKECKLPEIAVAVVPLHAGGALHQSALKRGDKIEEKDVKSVVNDHTKLCPLLWDLEERLKLPHMLRIDYTDILREIFVHGSDDDDGNHVKPISAKEYQRLWKNVGTLATNTIGRPSNKGGLVAGATKHTSKVIKYTSIAALEAHDGIDLFGLYEWYGKNPKCVYHDWGTNTLKMNCGPHTGPIEDRYDYTPEECMLGDLGAIPHLTERAYEIERIDDTVGYCFSNMLRSCFKHNALVHNLTSSYLSGLSKTEMHQSTGCASEDCSAGLYKPECICAFHRTWVRTYDVFTACDKCICL
jgi:hypothetical protein